MVRGSAMRVRKTQWLGGRPHGTLFSIRSLVRNSTKAYAPPERNADAALLKHLRPRSVCDAGEHESRHRGESGLPLGQATYKLDLKASYGLWRRDGC
jgi:hypothetical protein